MNFEEDVKHQLERMEARLEMLHLQMQTELRQLYRELGRHDARLDSLEERGGGQ